MVACVVMLKCAALLHWLLLAQGSAHTGKALLQRGQVVSCGSHGCAQVLLRSCSPA